MNILQFPLRLNVGFISHKSVGYSRNFPIEYQQLHLRPDLDLDAIKGDTHISRAQQGLLVEVILQASISAHCGRCLQPFQLDITAKFTEIYSFKKYKTKDVEFILSDDGHIDLEPLVREHVFLGHPINPICKPDCKGLCSVCGNNLNENDCAHDAPDIDPRLAKLKDLLDK